MNNAWNIREYQEGDEQAIFGLLNDAFGKWHSMEYWNWMYKKNPAGSPIIWLAEDNGRIISHLGLVPIKMKLGNTYLTACYGADAATHPDYQGKGVYTTVWSKANSMPAENGIPLTIVFPYRNLGVYKRTERKGHICLMSNMTKVLDWSSILRKPKLDNNFPIQALANSQEKPKSKVTSSGLEIKEINTFDERINTFWAEISKNYQIIVNRDQTYLNWRYANHPETKYTICQATKGDKILGYCVTKETQLKKRGIGLIIDILGFPNNPNAVNELIQNALTRFKEHKLQFALTEITEKNPYKRIFWKTGFIPYPRPRHALGCAINLPGILIEQDAAFPQALTLSQSTFLKKKSNWFMISGDFDWI